MKILGYVLAFLGVMAFITGFALLFTFPVMWAINYIFAPSALLAIFGTSQIAFWKTFALAWTVGWLFQPRTHNTHNTSK